MAEQQKNPQITVTQAQDLALPAVSFAPVQATPSIVGTLADTAGAFLEGVQERNAKAALKAKEKSQADRMREVLSASNTQLQDVSAQVAAGKLQPAAAQLGLQSSLTEMLVQASEIEPKNWSAITSILKPSFSAVGAVNHIKVDDATFGFSPLSGAQTTTYKPELLAQDWQASFLASFGEQEGLAKIYLDTLPTDADRASTIQAFATNFVRGEMAKVSKQMTTASLSAMQLQTELGEQAAEPINIAQARAGSDRLGEL